MPPTHSHLHSHFITCIIIIKLYEFKLFKIFFHISCEQWLYPRTAYMLTNTLHIRKFRIWEFNLKWFFLRSFFLVILLCDPLLILINIIYVGIDTCRYMPCQTIPSRWKYEIFDRIGMSHNMAFKWYAPFSIHPLYENCKIIHLKKIRYHTSTFIAVSEYWVQLETGCSLGDLIPTHCYSHCAV